MIGRKALVAVVAAASFGCGLDMLGILAGTDVGPDGGLVVDGSVTDASAMDGSSDADADLFGDVSVDGPCNVQLCDDGGACGPAFVCTAQVPLGWHVVELGPDPSAGCGSNYARFGTAAMKFAAAPAACTCTCSVSATGSCTGAVQLSHGNGASCDVDSGTYVGDGSCRILDNSGFLAPDPFMLNGVANGAYPVCGSAITPVIPSSDAGLVSVCRPPAVGPSCENNHRICAPRAAPGYQLCIASDLADGGVAPSCPPGFTVQSAVTVATSVTDTRGCGACSCAGTPGACSLTYTLYANTNCSGNSTGTSATGCSSTGTGGGPQQYKAGKFTVSGSAPGQACNKIADPPATGSVAATAGYAVCCQ